MNWILKITEGPMKGAEVALVSGTRITFGKSTSCDVVVADSALADEAFALDVTDASVTLVMPDGAGIALKPFETHTYGATEIALGPGEGEWEALRPAVVSEESADAAASDLPKDETDGSSADTPSRDVDNTPRKQSAHTRVRSFLLGLFLSLGLLVVLSVLAVWYFRAPLMHRFPNQFSWCRNVYARWVGASEPKVAVPLPSLREVAKEHKLEYVETPEGPRISGNLKRRTERLAFRALAFATDSRCQLDLSDDESFHLAAEALLFTVTEGAVRVFSASNRIVCLRGYAPQASALALVLDAIRHDVPWVAKIETGKVRVGGAIPADLRDNAFAKTGRLAALSAELAQARKRAEDKERAMPPKAVSVQPKQVVPLPPKSEEERLAEQLASLAAKAGGKLPRTAMLPVAGILTKPYPCIVLRDGHRVMVGAKISGLEVTEIASTRINFVYRGQTMWWEP